MQYQRPIAKQPIFLYDDSVTFTPGCTYSWPLRAFHSCSWTD